MQAWFESVLGVTNPSAEIEASNYRESENLDLSFKPVVPKGAILSDFEENLEERTYLYIQMEYCPRFDSHICISIHLVSIFIILQKLSALCKVSFNVTLQTLFLVQNIFPFLWSGSNCHNIFPVSGYTPD